jgi:hypothetical protein
VLGSRTGETLITSRSLIMFAYEIACTVPPLYIDVRGGCEIVREYGLFII